MRLELHCHSTHSDGSLRATDVALLAATRDPELFCLTDHDTFDGYEATRQVLEAPGCRVLRGLELSCREYRRTVHVLLYGLVDGPALDVLRGRLAELARVRVERLERICDRLDALGIVLDRERLRRQVHGRVAGRPDVARALVASGVCSTPQDAFTRFLRDGGVADVPIERLGVEEGVALGIACGARISLAHPHTLGEYHLVRDLFVRFRDHGLTGLEAYYGRYGPSERVGWLRLCREFDLVPTAGSDFHGDMVPDVTRPVVDVPDAVGERLLQWLDGPQ